MRFEYCPFCGAKAILRQIGDEGEIPCCEKCDRPLFDMFHTCVLCIVVNELGEVTLIRQSYGDTEKYVGVAGFMKVGETPEEAARREVAEETGLAAESVCYLDSCFYKEHERLMLGMLVRVKKSDFRISGELLEARWFTLDGGIKIVRDGGTVQKFLIKAREVVRE